MLADQFVEAGRVERFPLEQLFRHEIELVAMLRQDRAGVLVRVVEDFFHLHVDLADVSSLHSRCVGRRGSPQVTVLAVGHVDQPTRSLIRNADHLAGERRRVLQVVFGPRADLAEGDLFGRAAAEHSLDPVD